ncbi:MAG: Gp15 family bacteriophage protein [Dysgonomonas sp.]
MFNLLVDGLPKFVTIDNILYDINFNAHAMINIAILTEENGSNSDEEKSVVAMEQLRLFYPVLPNNLQEAMKKLIEFYTYPLDDYGKNFKNEGSKGFSQSSYSFKYDGNLIYSAFLQQYQCESFKNLHWFQFKSMLENLTEDCLFVKVMQYRTIKISKEMSKSEKAFYRKMKKLYQIPDNRPEEEKDKDFANVLFSL